MTKTTACIYSIGIVILSVAAIGLVVSDRTRATFLQRDYWRWLTARWKLGSFAVAMLGLVALTPWATDRDWDVPLLVAMATLTFVTAPAVVGELYLRRSVARLFVASVTWLFVASWSFDLYWFARRGFFPDAWLENLLASSMLYLSAGLLWNLDWRPGRGVTLAFLRRSQWLEPAHYSFWRIALPAVAIMTVVALSVVVPFAIYR